MGYIGNNKDVATALRTGKLTYDTNEKDLKVDGKSIDWQTKNGEIADRENGVIIQLLTEFGLTKEQAQAFYDQMKDPASEIAKTTLKTGDGKDFTIGQLLSDANGGDEATADARLDSFIAYLAGGDTNLNDGFVAATDRDDKLDSQDLSDIITNNAVGVDATKFILNEANLKKIFGSSLDLNKKIGPEHEELLTYAFTNGLGDYNEAKLLFNSMKDAGFTLGEMLGYLDGNSAATDDINATDIEQSFTVMNLDDELLNTKDTTKDTTALDNDDIVLLLKTIDPTMSVADAQTLGKELLAGKPTMTFGELKAALNLDGDNDIDKEDIAKKQTAQYDNIPIDKPALIALGFTEEQATNLWSVAGTDMTSLKILLDVDKTKAGITKEELSDKDKKWIANFAGIANSISSTTYMDKDAIEAMLKDPPANIKDNPQARMALMKIIAKQAGIKEADMPKTEDAASIETMTAYLTKNLEKDGERTKPVKGGGGGGGGGGDADIDALDEELEDIIEDEGDRRSTARALAKIMSEGADLSERQLNTQIKKLVPKGMKSDEYEELLTFIAEKLGIEEELPDGKIKEKTAEKWLKKNIQGSDDDDDDDDDDDE